jgi:long-chain acyl-CoA synthetase
MLIESLLNTAARQPQEIAVIDESGQQTYERLAGAAARVAAGVSAATQRPVVGLLLPSGAGFVASFYGTLWAGKAVVPINFLLSGREIGHVVADSGIDTVITIPLLATKLADLRLRILDVAQLTATPNSPPPLPKTAADDLAVLMYTSGTSGLPKGVLLSYGNLQSDVDAAIEHARLQHGHRFLGIIPLFHAFGMTASVLAPIQLGATIVYMARFSAPGAVKAIRDHAISLVFAIPSMYGAMLHLKSTTAADFGNIYAMISGGEPLPKAVADGFQQRFGLTIYEGYGLTETSPVVCLNVPGRQRSGSVGLAVPHARVRIAADDGADMPPGESGEVWLGGPMVMKGYHNLPAETAAALTADGFFKTGDLGRLDSDGYLYIVGRKKELIIVAGEKAVPREIEEALLTHAAVAEAAVVGKKDASRGEVVVAFVTAREGQTIAADALREACRAAGLPQWKIPREVFIETDLPRSPTGKVLKRVLAERVNRPTS